LRLNRARLAGERELVAGAKGKALGKMQAMARLLAADDIIPLAASWTPRERGRLLRLMASQQAGDASSSGRRSSST